MEKIIAPDYYDEHEDNEDEELINREDVWHFYAYFSGEAAGLIQEFLELCEIPDRLSREKMLHDNPPSERVCKDDFGEIFKALKMLVDYFKHDELILNGQEINFEWGDTVRQLTEGLHLMMNILPYLNLRHYDLSRERYEEVKYHQYSFEELQHLDLTLAKKILPTFIWFANHSIFTPQYFKRMYDYPRPRGYKRSIYNSCKQWDKALDAMVKSWEWLRDREQSNKQQTKWENVPDEIYYGLHLFAEYLPEMQND